MATLAKVWPMLVVSASALALVAGGAEAQTSAPARGAATPGSSGAGTSASPPTVATPSTGPSSTLPPTQQVPALAPLSPQLPTQFSTGTSQSNLALSPGSSSTSQSAPSAPGGGGKTLADCMGFWEPATHMTKAEWRAACRRTLNRLENP